ncbi:MAG TPA: hypothetical protein VKS22_14855 [Candidatus Binataceae bacterium]|nr:hypothetical protein [Candidatus Binataceae bacterium]
MNWHPSAKLLMAEVQQRSSQIDSKAAMILGWSTAVLAFLLNPLRGGGVSATLSLGLSVAGGLCALFAALQGYRALRARQDWECPSDADWFEKSALINGDELKRFHIRCWHGVRKSQNSLAEQKGTLLLSGQRLLLSAAAFLAAGLVARVLSQFFQVSSLVALDGDVWSWVDIARRML